MGYGQYSAGSCRRTKAEILESAFGGLTLATSRKAGHNRVHATGHDGVQYFSLHETIVAVYYPHGRLELADGGWPTPTTRSAWRDAVKAFGLHWGMGWEGWPRKDEREVGYAVDAERRTITGRLATPPSDPMIRADVGEGDGNFAVRYDGQHLISDAGVKLRVTPFKVLSILYRVDALARSMKGRFAGRGRALDEFWFDALGYRIMCGQSARTIMIGCHTFKTQDIRTEMRRIAGLYPAAVKPAKRWVKLNPTDFGAAEYEAMQASYRASLNARAHA